MSESEAKKIADLRVVDLKAELEKRGLDRNGVKQVLVERLSKALKEEGKDPDNFLFEPSDKKPRSSNQQDDEDKSEITEADSSVAEDKNENAEEEEKDVSENKDENEGDHPEDNTKGKPETTNKTNEETDGHESPIRLTLEEEETLHDDEADTTTEKAAAEDSEDKKNSTNEDSKGDSKSSKESSTSSGQDGSKDEKEAADASSSGKANDAKGKGKVSANQNPKVVWISNVAQNTRASELKAALSKFGKVTGAKVVVNARFPGSCCFGYVTMGSVEDADNVIAKLNNTELNGQIIKIDKFDHVRAEQMKQMRMAAGKGGQSEDKNKDSKDKDENKDKIGKDDDKKSPKKDDKEKKDLNNKDKKDGEKKEENKDKNGTDEGKKSRERNIDEKLKKRSDSRGRKRIRSNSRGRPNDVLTFEKIREERERQRLREKERILREASRRRHQEAMRQREVERRQRSEAQRLEREREKLKMEREKIEREKAELIRMERERQRLEREKIKAEKLELERTLIRLEEDRKAATKRPAPYRREDAFDDRKRPAQERHFKEPPPPPRFDTAPSIKPREPSPKKFGSNKDYGSRIQYEKKHEPVFTDKRSGRDYDSGDRGHQSQVPSRSNSGGNMNKYERSFDNRGDPRGRDLAMSRSKDNRYEERADRDRSPHHSYRGNIRDDRDRRAVPGGKPEIISNRDQRYPDTNSGKPRFDRNSSGNWNSHGPKPFNSGAGTDPWNKDTWRSESNNDRWNSGPGVRSLNTPFSGNSNLAPVCPPPPGINNYPDRFDYNKSMNSGGMRKY